MTSKLFTAYLFIISSFVVSQTTGEKDSTATVQTTSQTVEDTTQAVGDTTQVELDQIDKISTMVLANRITNVSGFERMIIGDLLGDEMMETSAASMVISEGQAKEAMGANFDPNCFSDSCAISIGKSFNLSNVITFGIINVKKIASLKDLFNKPISTVDFITNKTSQIHKISSLIKKKGLTEVKIKVKDKDNELVFKLKNKRLVDRKSINTLKNQDISTIIH